MRITESAEGSSRSKRKQINSFYLIAIRSMIGKICSWRLNGYSSQRDNWALNVWIFAVSSLGRPMSRLFSSARLLKYSSSVTGFWLAVFDGSYWKEEFSLDRWNDVRRRLLVKISTRRRRWSILMKRRIRENWPHHRESSDATFVQLQPLCDRLLTCARYGFVWPIRNCSRYKLYMDNHWLFLSSHFSCPKRPIYS